MFRYCDIVAAVLLTGSFASTASADLIQLVLSGQINSSNMTAFQVGQTMTVTLRYESSGSYQFVASQQAFYVDRFKYVRLQSGGYDTSDTGDFGQIDKYDGLGGTDGIQFQVAAQSATYQYTNPKPNAVQLANVFSNGVSQSFDNVFVNLNSSSNAVWNNYDLPTGYNFADFNAGQNAVFHFSGGSFMFGFSSASATNLTTLPEPAGAAMLGLAGLTMLSRRRK
ncbi:MAG: PEP-CTERM sorting domain-containing protein [Phycisphaeraceae bacterium]